MEALILSAIGQVVGTAGNIVGSYNERRNVKDTLDAQRQNRYHQVLDYEQKAIEKDNTNLIIIAILAFVVIALIIAVALKNEK